LNLASDIRAVVSTVVRGEYRRNCFGTVAGDSQSLQFNALRHGASSADIAGEGDRRTITIGGGHEGCGRSRDECRTGHDLLMYLSTIARFRHP